MANFQEIGQSEIKELLNIYRTEISGTCERVLAPQDLLHSVIRAWGWGCVYDAGAAANKQTNWTDKQQRDSGADSRPIDLQFIVVCCKSSLIQKGSQKNKNENKNKNRHKFSVTWFESLQAADDVAAQ